MAYNYDTEVQSLLATDDGIRTLLRVNQFLAGPTPRTFQEVMSAATGSSWEVQAALDYLIKLGFARRASRGNERTSNTIYTKTF